MATAASLALEVDRPAAALALAATADMLDPIREAVVDGELLAAADGALADVENVPLEDAGAEVRVATVVDDFGAGTAHRAIDGPVIVDAEQVGDRSLAAAPGLVAVEALAGVFDHLAVGGYRLERVHPAMVNPRLANLQPETRVPRVDGW